MYISTMDFHEEVVDPQPAMREQQERMRLYRDPEPEQAEVETPEDSEEE